VFAKIKPYFIGFVSGIVLYGIITLWISSGTANKLTADLRAAKWSLESAIRTNIELTTGIQELSIHLDKANKLIERNQSIIDNQQSVINRQQHIIDGIFETVQIEGMGIGDKIEAISEGFTKLYKLYH
jgi:hypothetical protein